MDEAVRIRDGEFVVIHGECFIDMVAAMSQMMEAVSEMRQIVAIMEIQNQDLRQTAKVTFH